MATREELETEIEREQAHVDEMKRRRAKGGHGGYDQEIDDVDEWLGTKRAILARRAPRIVIFERPERTFPGAVFEDGSRIPARHKAIEVVRHGQTVRSIGGRARVFDSFELLLDGSLAMAGTRREVMLQAERLAALNELGQVPLYLDTDCPRWLRNDSIRHMQQRNRAKRRKSRRVRKASKMRARRAGAVLGAWIVRQLSRPSLYPQMLTRSPL